MNMKMKDSMKISVLLAMHVIASNWDAVNVTITICNSFNLQAHLNCTAEENAEIDASKEDACDIAREDTNVDF
jgi:hypothetical protein